MTGRLPHRVSDALSTKTDRSYVSPSPKNSLSFQELPHNQSKQTDQNPRWNCPWQPSNNGILAVPIQTHTNTANVQRLWNLSKTKQSKHHPHLPRQDLNPNTTTNNTTNNNATICLFIFHNFIILHKKQKQRNQKTNPLPPHRLSCLFLFYGRRPSYRTFPCSNGEYGCFWQSQLCWSNEHAIWLHCIRC